MTGKDNQRYGDLAENLFEGLALRWFEVTKPQKDFDGWDFMLRLRTPPKVLGFEAFLEQPPPFRYWVQVKSVLAKEGARLPKRISVNLERIIGAAKDTSPWFFFVVRHAPTWEPYDMFIFHIDEFWINKVARRRSADPDADPSDLTIDLPLAAGKQVTNEQCVLDYIVSACEGDPGMYAAKKSQSMRHAGLEAIYSEISFTSFTHGEGIEAASELSLGLRTVDGVELRQTEIRFGKKYTKTLLSNARARGRPIACPSVTISSTRPGGAMTMLSKLYTNRGIGRKFAFRIETDALDIVVHPDESKGTIRLTHIDANERVKISRLSACARNLILLEEAKKGEELLAVRLGPVTDIFSKPMTFQIGMDTMPQLPDWMAYVYMRGHELFRFARKHGVDDDFSCGVVEVYENGPAIAMALLFSRLEKSTASLELHSDSAPATTLIVVPIAVAFSIAGFHGYVTGYFCGAWAVSAKSSEWLILAEPEICLLQSDFGIEDVVAAERLTLAIAAMEAEVEKLDNVTVFINDSYICRTFKVN